MFFSKSNVHYMNNIICRYSSQFNPDLAKQNKLDPKRKYWLEWLKINIAWWIPLFGLNDCGTVANKHPNKFAASVVFALTLKWEISAAHTSSQTTHGFGACWCCCRWNRTFDVNISANFRSLHFVLNFSSIWGCLDLPSIVDCSSAHDYLWPWYLSLLTFFPLT